MDKWKKVKISDLGQVVGGATPSTKKEEYYNGDIAWITPKDLSDFHGRYISKGERSITKTGMDSCSTQLLPKNTILFSSRAPIGYVAIAQNEMCTNQGFKSVIPNDNVDYLFLYYLLKYNRNIIESMGSGTTFKEVSGSTMRNIEVMIPESTAIQRGIAAILDSIDSKIENNQKINNNLQQQLAMIYQSWYEDFSLINNVELIETDYGLIPKGWHYSLLGELCQSISTTHKFDKEELVFLNTGDVENGRVLHSNLMAVKDMPGQAKKAIASNDILYSEIRPINRHFAYVDFPSEDYVVSTKLMVIRANSFDSRRLYHYLTSDDVLAELQLQAESRSGTFPQIRFDNVSKLPILIADEQTENVFIELLHVVYGQIEHINRENEELSNLRDSLLPKLMSGEISVSDIHF